MLVRPSVSKTKIHNGAETRGGFILWNQTSGLIDFVALWTNQARTQHQTPGVRNPLQMFRPWIAKKEKFVNSLSEFVKLRISPPQISKMSRKHAARPPRGAQAFAQAWNIYTTPMVVLCFGIPCQWVVGYKPDQLMLHGYSFRYFDVHCRVFFSLKDAIKCRQMAPWIGNTAYPSWQRRGVNTGSRDYLSASNFLC